MRLREPRQEHWPGMGQSPDLVDDADGFKLASDAYVYGYPLVTMEMTRRVITNVAKPEGTRAPMGTLITLRRISRCLLSRCHGTQCGHALYNGLLRCRR